MPQPVWQQWCERLAAAPRPPPPGSELAEWLQHQRGLAALGWLPPKRRAALVALQVLGAGGCVSRVGRRLAGCS